MSTSHRPNGRDATDESRSQSHDPPGPLPVFHSIRTASRERISSSGSVASSSSSPQHGTSHAATDHLHAPTATPVQPHTPKPTSEASRLSVASSTRSDQDVRGKDKQKENQSRRHNVTRNSGGFLLEPVTNAAPPSRPLGSASRRVSRRERDRDEAELAVRKTRTPGARHFGTTSSSFKSSPLASEVSQDPSRLPSAQRGGDYLAPDSSTARSLSSSHDESRVNGTSPSRSRCVDDRKPAMATVGLDHDPAQIVNMALTLSEGRRRLASGRRYVSAEQGERRIVSTASTLSPRNTVKRNSLAPFLATPKRQLSRNASPRPKFTAVYHDPGQAATPGRVSPSLPPDLDDVDAATDMADDISPATLARVHRAQTYFELAYEHRRLLSHLPPIRKPGTQARSDGPEALQKSYNPLQYVRNRKLRIWEKTPIDSEADGWHDAAKVRTWVNAVVSSHPETGHESLECLRLPPLDQKVAQPDADDADGAPTETPSAVAARAPDHLHLHPRPVRPRSDWVTHPADLLADAFWLEQGMNKAKIQDRDNNLIYPPNTHFRFSGWRNQTPVDIPILLQQQPMPQPPDTASPLDDEVLPSALPELPTFKSAHHVHNPKARRNKIKDRLQIADNSSSRERSRIRRRLFQASSGSEYSDTSGSDNDPAQERGRKMLRRKRNQSPVHDAKDDESQSHSKGSRQSKPVSQGASSQGSSAPNSQRSSVDHSALNKIFRVDSIKRASPLSKAPYVRESSEARPTAPPIRTSLDEAPPRASTDYDTATAPSSPAGVEWPSIAINLSPPPSRSSSPVRKVRSTILHQIHLKRHKNPEQVSTADFATVQSVEDAPEHGSDPDKHPESLGSRGTSPMTRGQSPLSKSRSPSTQVDELPATTISPNESKPNKATAKHTPHPSNDYSRIRGMFKGGRIAELVGNEVSRVGDYIWKRDPPSLHRPRGSTSAASVRSFRGSESEKEGFQNGTAVKTPPSHALRSRSSTLSSTKSERTSPTWAKTSPPSHERPRYNNPNLPSFTSPFQKDREQQEKKQALLTLDGSLTPGDGPGHTSHLAAAAAHRSASHSPRRDRLALPTLNMTTSLSPDTINRKKSYGFGGPLDLSRSRDASDLLNTAIGHPSLRPTKSVGDLAATNGVEAGEGESEPTRVTWRDIGRAEALLYSSVVKAREIVRRADDTGPDLPRFLFNSLTPENQTLHSAEPLRIKRRERHIVAAKNTMKTLDGYSSQLNGKLHDFNVSIAPNLHAQLQTLEDMIENRMTPQVRSAVDEAGELSMKLTTTSTLAIKGLNDSIEAAFRRRRRRPVRLVRKVWYAAIEWTVVGILWLIWAIVSVIRLATGTIGTVFKCTRWLLWID